MPRALLAALLLALPACAAGGSIPPEGLELAWRGQVGDVLRQRMHLSQVTENSMLPVRFETRSEMVLRQEVLAVSPEGVGTIELRYEAMRLESQGLTRARYDSTLTGAQAADNDARLTSLFGPMLQARLTIDVEPSGRVRRIVGLEQALHAVIARTVDAESAQLLQQAFSEDSVRRMVELNVFPPRLQRGARWERTLSVDLPGLGTMETLFESRLVGTRERQGESCARIRIGGAIRLLDGAPVPPPGTPRAERVHLDEGQVAGEMDYALSSGFLLESALATHMVLTMQLADDRPPGMPEEIRVETTTEQALVRIGLDEPFFR